MSEGGIEGTKANECCISWVPCQCHVVRDKVVAYLEANVESQVRSGLPLIMKGTIRISSLSPRPPCRQPPDPPGFRRLSFELHQLKSAPSQLLPVVPRISPVANLLAFIWTAQYVSYICFQGPTNFFFTVMTTGQELDH